MNVLKRKRESSIGINTTNCNGRHIITMVAFSYRCLDRKEEGLNMITEFGKFCRKLRIDHDELMKDMAEMLGVTSSYLSAVETGKRNIPNHWPMLIASHYDLSEKQINQILELYIINNLNSKERAALDHAVSAIYFEDSSDYLSALYGVVSSLIGNEIVNNDGFSPERLFDLLRKRCDLNG